MNKPQDPEALPLGMEKAEKVPFRDCDGFDHNPLQEITQELAGHIRQPMGAHEIAKKLETAEYSAEIVMQHLLRLLNDGVCDWEQNENGWWNTDCGNAFEFTDGGPIYNEFKSCPYCGKTLTETPYSEDDDSLPNIKIEDAQRSSHCGF